MILFIIIFQLDPDCATATPVPTLTASPEVENALAIPTAVDDNELPLPPVASLTP